jgi:hypothetical protein
VLTTVALLALRGVAEHSTPGHRARFVTLSLGVVVLTLAMVVSAFHRVVLYEAVFGLTMLRVFAQAAIVWIGIVLVLVGARVVGVGGRRAWLTGASAASALVILFALNVMNPESFVARYNITHEHDPAPFDRPYLSKLSDDAVPTVAKVPAMKDELCAPRGSEPEGWAAYNVARQRARDVRTRLCSRGG